MACAFLLLCNCQTTGNEKKLSIERIGRNRKNDKNADSGFRDILSDTWIGVLFSFEK